MLADLVSKFSIEIKRLNSAKGLLVVEDLVSNTLRFPREMCLELTLTLSVIVRWSTSEPVSTQIRNFKIPEIQI